LSQNVVCCFQENNKVVSPILLAAVCGMIRLVLVCVRRIPHGQVYTLRSRGGRIRTVGEGVHLVLPLLDRVAHKINLAGAAVAVDDLRRAERDYRALVYFQVVDPQQADVVIDDVEGLLRVTTRRLFDYAVLPDDADARRRWLKQSLNSEVRERGLLVARIDLAATA
jgi:regulator of protease activity HflC (stomatin/prohibitin superfamily)